MTCNCNNNESNESNATECNETCPTTCATQTFVNNCGCSSGCGCNPASPGTAVPYYNAAEGCEESHSRVCVSNRYVTGVMMSNTVHMPACNATTFLTIPGLQLINIGVYLWNPIYGYLKVISFDLTTGTVVVENECLVGNAVPGTIIPSCTIFTVVDIPNISTNPCVNNVVNSGSLMVCSGGVMHPLDGSDIGQIPVLIDPVNNIVSFQTIDIPTRICEELTIDLTLIAGNAGPYVLTVTDTATFAPGNILQLNGRTDRFTVVLVTAPTTFTATVDPLPGNEVIPATTPVCHIGCCEDVENLVIQNNTNIYNYVNGLFADPCSWDTSGWIDNSFGGTIGNGQANYEVSVGDGGVDFNGTGILEIHNTSCKLMVAQMLLDYEMSGGFECNIGDYADVVFTPQFGYLMGAAPGGTPVLGNITTLYRHEAFHKAGTIIGTTVKDSYTFFNTRLFTVIAGNYFKYRVGAHFEIPTGTAGVKYKFSATTAMGIRATVRFLAV